jgi:hypothetical protein
VCNIIAVAKFNQEEYKHRNKANKKKKEGEIEEKRRRYKKIQSKVLDYNKKMSKGIEV